MPTVVIRCTHCGRNVRVESVGYENTCPVCSNVLPPSKALPQPSVITTEKMQIDPNDLKKIAEVAPLIPQPPPAPVTPAPVDGEGVDFGDSPLDLTNPE